MRKKTIAIFFIISTVLFLAGIGLYIAGLASTISTLATVTPTVTTNGTATLSPTDVSQVVSSTNIGLIIGGASLLIISGIVFLVSWIGALIATAKRSSWAWFVCIILFHWITVLIYLFAGPAVDAPIVQPYQPYPQNPQYPQYPQYPS